jgi:hypothetical protein
MLWVMRGMMRMLHGHLSHEGPWGDAIVQEAFRLVL